MKEAQLKSSTPATSCLLASKPGEKIACGKKPRRRSMSVGQTLASFDTGIGVLESKHEPVLCQYADFLSSHAVSKGLLRVVQKQGFTYFVFSEIDGEDYVAIPKKVNSAINSTLSYVYLFYTMESTGMVNCSNNLCGSIGMMKVSSHPTSPSEEIKSVETEFITYVSSKDHLVDRQTSVLESRNKIQLLKKVLNVFHKDQSYRKRTTQKSTEHLAAMHSHCINDLNRLSKETDHVDLAKSFQTGLELVAIVTRDYICDEQNTSSGGWGMKFLQKKVDARLKLSEILSIPLASCIPDAGGSARRIDVLVPTGFHNFQKGGSAIPSSLIKRWESGRCDCGGWDMGCPFSVLRSWVDDGKSYSEIEPWNDSTIVKLVKEGQRTGRPSVTIEALHEKLYLVHFQSNLTSIQSFSIGLSVIHSFIRSSCSDV